MARPRLSTEHRHALLQERRAQVRGLLWLGLMVLVVLLLRARPLLLFRLGWWRL